MMALSIGMFAVAFVYWFAVRKDLAKPVIYALSFVGISVSIAVIVMIALIGHSGAAASWSSVLG
jgi:branched-subunit amino acid transport protein